MQLQETIELTTSLTGAKVVLRGYITGRIKQEIQGVLLSSTQVTDEGKTTFDGAVALAATNKALELIVLSVNGKSEGVLDMILDLPEQDFDFVKGEVDKVQDPLVENKPKN